MSATHLRRSPLFAWLLLATVALLAPHFAFAQSTTDGVRLEAGIAKEDVDGDLKTAIEIYQKIAADSTAPRDVRAKALLRLAGCYEKLGHQARQVYERIVRDFADQPVASQARSRLAALAQQERPQGPAPMTVRKIQMPALGNMSAMDTDGQRRVYWDSTSDSLFFGDLAGRSKRLFFKQQPGHAATNSVPSQDLSMVLLLFPGNRDNPVSPLSTVAVVRNDGTGYRELIRNDAQASAAEDSSSWWCCRWSWDNRSFLVAHNPPTGGGHLFIVSIAGGERRELLSLKNQQFVKAVFSPDGRNVAYEAAPQPGQVEPFRVFVMPVQGGDSRLIHESAPKSRLPPWSERWSLMDWTADGRYLLIADSRYGKTGLYLFPVKNGAASGPPALLRYGDFRDGHTTTTGAFIYEATKTSGNTDIYLASLDSEGRLGTWRRLDLVRRSPFNPFPSFSPDGQKMAYTMQEEDLAAGKSLMLRDVSTAKDQLLYRSAGGLICQYAIEHPSIFCLERRNAGGKTDLLSISVESGQVERRESFSRRLDLLWPTRDDRALYLLDRDPLKAGGRILRWESSTHQETVVSSEAPEGVTEWLLDDRWLVRLSGRDLPVRPMSGGDWKSLVSFRSGGAGAAHVAITRDDKWVLYHDADSAGKPALFRVPIDGGGPQRLGDFPSNMPSGSLHISPDGRQIAAVTFDPNWYELWMLENFIPSGKQ